jgi:hypothetical protein
MFIEKKEKISCDQFSALLHISADKTLISDRLLAKRKNFFFDNTVSFHHRLNHMKF